jgi:hypothetical protein
MNARIALVLDTARDESKLALPRGKSTELAFFPKALCEIVNS